MIFWLLCALMLLAALGWLLPPLLRAGRARSAASGNDSDIDSANAAIYRAQLADLEVEYGSGAIDAQRYEEAKRAITGRLALELGEGGQVEASPAARAQPVLLAVMVGILLPLAALALYHQLGNPKALGVGAKDAAAQRELETMTPERIADMVQKLENHLKSNPNDAKGWSVLARTHRGLGQLPKAVQAFERAVALAPADAGLKVDFAELLGAQANGDLRGRPSELLDAALKLAPDDPNALALAGSAAGQRGDNAQALRLWEKLLTLLPPEAEVRPLLEQRIAELRGTAKPAQAGGAQTAPRKLTVRVSLSPALAAQSGEQDSVFVFARAAQGPKMPLAVARAKVSELPREFTLSDADAMTPELALSNFGEVVVGARVSKGGGPVAASGDLEGLSAAVKADVRRVEVIIDRVVP